MFKTMQMQISAVFGMRGATPRPLLAPGNQRRSRVRGTFRVFASDDEDMVPIFSGRKKKGFTEQEYEQLRNPKLLGGKTIGEELELLHTAHQEAEARASELANTKLASSHWDGDVYIGGRWNELSVLYLIFMLAPAAVGIFAWLSYGHLWGVTPGLY